MSENNYKQHQQVNNGYMRKNPNIWNSLRVMPPLISEIQSNFLTHLENVYTENEGQAFVYLLRLYQIWTLNPNLFFLASKNVYLQLNFEYRNRYWRLADPDKQ